MANSLLLGRILAPAAIRAIATNLRQAALHCYWAYIMQYTRQPATTQSLRRFFVHRDHNLENGRRMQVRDRKTSNNLAPGLMSEA
jgi:hypothetical protein